MPNQHTPNSARLHTCEHCADEYLKPTKYGNRPSRFCSRRCSTRHTATRTPLAVRFWAKVAQSDGCWEWTGSRNARGYGKLSRDHVPGNMEYAHRVSYELNVGPIPTGMDVRHFICDNPPCVRPSRLDVGPRRVNMQDAVRKGRIRRGPSHPYTRISDDQVREIRTRFKAGDIRQAALAAEFGITERYVSQIVSRTGRASVV